MKVLFFDRSNERDLMKSWFGPARGGSHVKRAPQRGDEARSIGSGYDSAAENPSGNKDDLLTLVKPSDMDAVAVSRGGWKGIGDIEVKGSGFGLVKFIWRHGEKSIKKPPELQITRDDVIGFPHVIREFNTSRDASEGSPGREWRALMPNPDFGDRVIVYADALMGSGRHLVSVYVQDPKGKGADAPLSKRKTDTSANSPGKRFEAHTGDTEAGFLHQPSQSVSADSTIPKEMKKSSEPIILLLKATTTKTVTIPAFTDKNGRFVAAHVKIVHFDPNKSVADVVSGNGSHSQKKAHAKLHKYPGFKDLHEMDKYHHILSSGTNIQKKASLSAAISAWKDSILANKAPTPSVQAAFDSLPEAKKAELLALVSKGKEPASFGDGSHLAEIADKIKENHPEAVVTDVTPAGYGPDPIPDPMPDLVADLNDNADTKKPMPTSDEAENAVAYEKLNEIAAGKGGHYAGIAYKKLVGTPAFEQANSVARLGMVVKLGKELQQAANESASVSYWKKKALAGKNPSAGEWSSFNALSTEKKSALLDLVKDKVGDWNHLSHLDAVSKAPSVKPETKPGLFPPKFNDFNTGIAAKEWAKLYSSGDHDKLVGSIQKLAETMQAKPHMQSDPDFVKLAEYGATLLSALVSKSQPKIILPVGPKDGDTKAGADGSTLTFKDGRWHKYVNADESGELPAVLVPVAGDWVSSTHKHTKTGESIPLVTMPKSTGKLSSDEYGAVSSKAKANGGAWSKVAKGFLFKTPDGADKFAAEMNSSGPVASPVAAQEPSATGEKVYLHVPFASKETAKKYGAKWDTDKKLWYAHKGYANGSEINPSLAQFVPDVGINGHDKMGVTVAAINHSTKTGEPYIAHTATPPYGGKPMHYVAHAGTGASAEPMIDQQIGEWSKHGSADSAKAKADGEVNFGMFADLKGDVDTLSAHGDTLSDLIEYLNNPQNKNEPGSKEMLAYIAAKKVEHGDPIAAYISTVPAKKFLLEAEDTASQEGTAGQAMVQQVEEAGAKWLAANPGKDDELKSALDNLGYPFDEPGLKALKLTTTFGADNPDQVFASGSYQFKFSGQSDEWMWKYPHADESKWVALDNDTWESSLNTGKMTNGDALTPVKTQEPPDHTDQGENTNFATYHNTTDGHNKFWSVSVQGNSVVTKYGKIGAKGTSTVKEMASGNAAEIAMYKLISEKQKKGYVLQGGEQDSGLVDVAALADAGPKEGDTKQGADGMLVFKDGRWHKAAKPATIKKLSASEVIKLGKGFKTNAGNKAKIKAFAVSGDADGLKGFIEQLGHKFPASKKVAELVLFAMANAPETPVTSSQSVGKKSAASGQKTNTPPPAQKISTKAVNAGATVINGWTQTGEKKGSNPGGVFKDKAGQQWYCKFPSNPDVVRNEFLAAKLYEMLGVKVPTLKLVEKDGKLGIASKWVDGLSVGSAADLSKTKGAHEAFAIDAWIGNWDVVGLSNDNLMIGPRGAVRVDVGGSLLYRAQGEAKGAAFGDDVAELETLLDASKNDKSASVFKGVTNDSMLVGAGQLAKLKPSQITELCRLVGPGDTDAKLALANKLIARRSFVLKKLGIRDPWNKAPPDKTKLKVEKTDLPPVIEFANWEGKGKGLSTSAKINEKNTADSAALVAFAAQGNLTALESYQYDAIDKATGLPAGKKPISQHPSSHIIKQWSSLCDLLTAIAHPPQDSLAMPSIGGGSMEEVSDLAGFFKPGENINTVSSDKVIGYWLKLAHVGADSVAELVPKKTIYFTKAVVEKSKTWFNACKSGVQGLMHAIQGSGEHNHYWNKGSKTISVSGYSGPPQSLAAQCYQDAKEYEEGTRIHRWMNMPQNMMDHLLKEGPGLVLQNADSMCCSVIKNWGDQSHFGNGAFLNITYADGAKALDSMGSGSFKASKFDSDGHPLFTPGAEVEVTTLMGARFVVLGIKKGNASSSSGITMDLLMLPPHEGYVAELGKMAALGKSIMFILRAVQSKVKNHGL